MNKSIIVSVFLLLIFSFSLSSQRSHLGFSLGTSIPQSFYAQSEDIFNDGYAIPGFPITFEGIYYPISIVGVGGMLSFGSLYANKDLYIDDFLEYAYEQTEIPIFPYPLRAEDLNTETGFWNYVNLMAGPEISVPFWRFQAGIRAFGGLNFAVYPRRDIDYSDGNNQLIASTKGLSVSPAYLFGGNILYRSPSGTGIKIGADYLHGMSKYDFMMETVFTGSSQKIEREEEIELEAISISLGFFYVF